MNNRLKITVFTPTYNRAYIIPQLYASLCRQTISDFEWLVIDDGSTDDTEILFSKWIKEYNPFPVRYIKQSNGGKCRALNHALDLAEGELFLTVDSDDYLIDDAIEKIINWVDQLPSQSEYCGVAGNLGTDVNETPNTRFEAEFFDGSLLNRYDRIDGERAIAFFTDVHRKYPYPVYKNEIFMTEAVAWNRMAHDGYKMRFFNDILCIYEYREDGLTMAGSKLFLNNPHGYGLFLREKSIYLNESLLQRYKMIYTFTCDLSTRYNHRLIAECIGASSFEVLIFSYVHKLINFIKMSKVMI